MDVIIYLAAFHKSCYGNDCLSTKTSVKVHVVSESVELQSSSP